MGLITQAVDRVVPKVAARPTAAVATSATVSNSAPLRRAQISGAAMYRNWAIHGELPRAGLDIKIGQLAGAEWDLVPYDNNGPTPDPGKMRRLREIFGMPNPGEEGLGTFLQQLGEDLWTLDAAPFEKERTFRGELIWVWPVDGALIQPDRAWNGDPRSTRYWYVPSRPDEAVPLSDLDLGYVKIHTRSYSPLGIPPFETLKFTIESELMGSMYNARQVTQAAPDGIMDLGENARPDQVETFKALWNTLIAGKSMMAFWGGTKSAKFIPFKAGNKEMQFIEWQEYLVRKLCAVLHLSPQDLGFSFDINKSTGEVQQSQTDDKSTFGFTRVQDILTKQICWDPSFGGKANNIAFRFTATSDRQSKSLAETQKLTLAGMPSESINEARKRSGKPPIGDPKDESNPFNKLMANTPQGLVILDDIPTARELAMRGMNPDGSPVEKPTPPPPDMPPAVKAALDALEVSKSQQRDVLALLASSQSRPIEVHTPVTIEKGAVSVEMGGDEQPPSAREGLVRDITFEKDDLGRITGKTETETWQEQVLEPVVKTRKIIRESTFQTDEKGRITGKIETQREVEP